MERQTSCPAHRRSPRTWVLALILGLIASSCVLQQPSSLSKDEALPHKQLAAAATFREPDASNKVKVQAAYGKLPLSFEANQGQTDAKVKFLSRGRGYTLFLTPTEAVLALRKPHANEQIILRMQLIGANPNPQMAGLEELPGKVNYFLGNDPKKWRSNIPNYARVQYQDVYPGVNLVYYGHQRQLEYDFIVAPGADPKVIKLAFEGADKVEIDAQGDLILHTEGGEVRLLRPRIYQEINGTRQAISGRYVLPALETRNSELETQKVGFEVAAYDAGRPLIIDPVLSYSTYLGGSGDDSGLDIAVDSSGNVYVTGVTNSLNFPTTAGAFLTTFGGGTIDAFVTKFNPTGSVVYSTYLGGSGAGPGESIAVDSSGNAYVTGRTDSLDFPTANPFQPDFGGGPRDAFVAKITVVGGSVTGVIPRWATCRNQTTEQAVEIRLMESAQSWNCEAAGLEVSPGGRVLQRAFGIAE